MNEPLPAVKVPVPVPVVSAKQLLQKMVEARAKLETAYQARIAAEMAEKNAQSDLNAAEVLVKEIPQLQAGGALIHDGNAFSLSRNMGFSKEREYTINIYPIAEE